MTCRPPAAVGLAIALCIARPAIAVGQAPARRDSVPVPLGELVVSAQRPAVEAATTVRERDSADVRAVGARTLSDALALLPGLHSRLAAEGVVRLDLRGYRTRHVQLLLDGVPINSSFDGQFDPTTIPIELIDRVKLTTGVPSVLYGQGGLGGVINVITGRATERPSITASAEIRGGGGHLARATGSGRWAGIEALVAASTLDQEAFPSWNGSPSLGPVSPAPRSNADFLRRSFFASLTRELAPGWRLGVEGNWIGARGGAPPSLIDQPADSFAQRPRYERLDHADGGRLQFAAEGSVGKRLSLRSWAFRNWLFGVTNRFADSLYRLGTVPGTPGTVETVGDAATRGVATQVSWTGPGRLTLALGAEGDRWTGFEAATTGSGSGGRGAGGGGSQASRTDTTMSVARLTRYRVAFGYSSPRWAGLQAVAGLLEEWQRGTGTKAVGTGVTLGATFQVSRRTRLRASYGRLFRFPSVSQLFDLDAGNPSLAPEQSHRVEAGIDLEPTDRLRLSMVLFHDRARDLIERPNPDSAFANREASRFQGFELEGTWRRDATLLRVGWSFLDAVDRSAGGRETRLPYRPRHKLTAEGRRTWRFGLDAAMSVRYVAGQVYDSRRGPSRSRPLPDYALVGLRVGQRIPLPGASIYFGVDNLFDQAYEEAYGFPQAGRTAYLGLDTRF